jgi:hypothetical protein
MDKIVRESNDKVDANVNHTGNITVNFGNNTLHTSQGAGEDTPSNTE